MGVSYLDTTQRKASINFEDWADINDFYNTEAGNGDCGNIPIIGVGIALKVPDFNVALDAEFNNQGVCPDSSEFGAKFSGGIGVDLNVAAYTEKKGAETPEYSLDLYNNPNLYAFPDECFGFGPKASASSSSKAVSSTTASSKASFTSKSASSTSSVTAVSSASAHPTGKPTATASGTSIASSYMPTGTGSYGSGSSNGTYSFAKRGAAPSETPIKLPRRHLL